MGILPSGQGRFALQVRGEFSNAFNFVNLSAPTVTLSSSQFGKIVSAGGMRNGQLECA